MGMRRYLYAGVGILVMLAAGFIYAWSILSAPIALDFQQWNNTQLSLTFTICITCFCLGGLVAGLLSKKISVKMNMRVSSLLFITGFVLTSQASSLIMLYISYGILCGTASGFAYNSVMNIIPRWFPKQQGTISGILLMGFGASSLVIGTVFTAITPNLPSAWRDSLLILGLFISVIIFAGSFFFLSPETDKISVKNPSVPFDKSREFTTVQMIQNSDFWKFFVWATLICAVGLVIIAQARAIAQISAPAIGPGAVSFIVGLISICNGLGRIIFGRLFDRVGRTISMLLVVLFCFAGIGITWLSLSGAPLLLVAGFILVGLGYGGAPTISAAVTKQFFGEKNYPINFSIVNISLLVASFASTGAGAILDAMNSFALIFTILFIMLAVAFFSFFHIQEA